MLKYKYKKRNGVKISMKTRILSGIMMLPLLLIILSKGMPLYIASFLLTLISIKEFSSALNTKNIVNYPIFGYILSTIFFINNIIDLDKSIFIILITMVSLLNVVCTTFKSNKIFDLLIIFIGYIYITLGFNAIIFTSNHSVELMWIIFIISLVSDTMAYFIGSIFGKHKLVPKLSPKKTIEGSIGAIFFCTLSCVLFGLNFNLNIGLMIFIGILGSIISQLGDLLASFVKRYVGIKDYGNIIPGHGGILDRFDSVILVSQFIYIIVFIIY